MSSDSEASRVTSSTISSVEHCAIRLRYGTARAVRTSASSSSTSTPLSPASGSRVSRSQAMSAAVRSVAVIGGHLTFASGGFASLAAEWSVHDDHAGDEPVLLEEVLG